MNLVIDTNIVFSAILNPKSNIGEILLNYQDKIKFYAPEFLLFEIEKYNSKIKKISKLPSEEILISKILVLNSITFISEELILNKNWEKAFQLTKDIDEDDTPFVALALQMDSKLWSGDKKLTSGLLSKNSKIIYTTQQLKNLLSI
jgi:predicted nucleic acid-binding protein